MNIRIAATRAVVFALLAVGPVSGFRSVHALEGVPAQERVDAQVRENRTGADTLYREAREFLNQRQYERALELFRRLQREYTASEFSAQSAYWEAYSLYRLGGTDHLQEAMAVLEARARESHERGQPHRDMAELEARIAGQLASSGNAEYYERIRSEAAAQCDRDNLGVKLEALRALARLDSDLAEPSIRRILEQQDVCAIELRRQAVFMITQVMDALTAESLVVSVARTDPSVEVQSSAFIALGQLATFSIDFLAETAISHEDQRVRQGALMALVRSERPAAADALRRIAESETTPERDRAVAIMGLARNRGANVAYLKDLFQQTRSPEVRLRVMQIVGGQAHGEENDWLLGIARDSTIENETRMRALFFAVQGDADISHLIEMYRSEQDPELRENIVMVISRYQSRDPRALDIIIDVARNSEDTRLRRQAIAWLSQSDSPRAAEVLVELLEQ